MSDHDVSTLSEDVIVGMIMREARRCNDPAPASIEYIYGTRYELTNLTGSIVFSDAPSVMVVATGNFSMPILHGPVPYPDKTGSVIALVIDQQTGYVTDSGIMDRPLDLASLGHVFLPAVPKG